MVRGWFNINKCDVCGGKLILKEKKIISNTTYRILECGKCNKQVVKHQD